MKFFKLSAPDALFYAVISVFFAAFLLYPAAGVIIKTFWFNGTFTPDLFWFTITSPVVMQATFNSLVLSIITLLISTCIALLLALFVSGYDFRFKNLISGMVLVPMIMPPFVGAIGIERIFARYGSLNMLFGIGGNDWISQGGLPGVALLQALHLFPIMYLNLTAALSNIDPELKEAARISGASSRKIFRDITMPLMMPGLFSGAILVFLWSLTDLGTPLVLGFRNLLAVEVFDRTTAINNDPAGSAMVVLLMIITVGILFSAKHLFIKESYSAAVKGFRAREFKKPSRAMLVLIYSTAGIVFALSLMPHIGLILTSLAKDWFMTVLPSGYSTEYFRAALAAEGVGVSARNSALYALASTSIDVVLGFILAWFVLRRKIKGGWLVDAVVMLPLALPGLVLAFGYVATFSGTFLDPLKNPVPLLIIGYAVRRLPYMFRAVYAGLSQASPEFEEASRVCGAGAIRTAFSITTPLIAASIIAGSIMTFMFAVLEVSESMVLAVKKEFFPITRQIYAMLGMIPDGDYTASALGVLCMLFMAAGIGIASVLMGKQMGKMFRL